MFLRRHPVPAVPEQTAQVARAAFPKGSRYMRMRDGLGPIFAGSDLADLFPGVASPPSHPGGSRS